MLKWMTLLLLLLSAVTTQSSLAAETKKIVLIAGPKSHGPEGNGIHDYPWSAKLLKVMLDHSNIREQVRVEFHRDGMPRDLSTLDDADTIMVISDGRDGDLYQEAPHFGSEENLNAVQKQIDRGCGFLTFHFSTFAPDKHARQILDWSGGYFDWETDGKKQWYSAIKTLDTAVTPATPDHPVLRGMSPFRMKEEFYFNIRFQLENQDPLAGSTAPLLKVQALGGREPDGNVVAWARERANGGRGFGTTCGHFYANWEQEQFRRMILNAIAWTAKVEIPAGGVSARYYSQAEITQALAGVEGTQRASVDDKPIRVLLLAGNEAHKWHNWEKTTPAIKAALEKDPRIKVEVTLDPEDFSKREIAKNFDVIVHNYVNWHDPRPLSDDSKVAYMNFLQNGGGAVFIHFGSSLFHFSLPMAEASDWPELRKVVRRVWNHHGQGEAKSGHDAFGRFDVKVTGLSHPVTEGLSSFTVTDELYFRQDGAEPFDPLISAVSKVTQREEPLAAVYTYGKGRIFQTLLGHSEKTYEVFEPREMLRRGVAWAAGRKVIALTKSDDPDPAVANGKPAAAASPRTAEPAAPARVTLGPGKFGQALNAAAAGLFLDAKPEHREAPVTVECLTKLNSKASFNILIASEPKASATHWELYSYAGSGFFSVFLPGRGGEYRSNVDIADGQWHHVAMQLDLKRLRLFVDGRMVLDRLLPGEPAKSTSSAISFGRLVEGGIGCDGLLDEVRFRRGAHPCDVIPAEPLKADDSTIGLWHFDELLEGGAAKDESAQKLNATPAIPPGKKVAADEISAMKQKGHWSRAAVGFTWTEENSVDDRWSQTKIGRWLGSLLQLPEKPGRKMLSIRLGPQQEATISYDTQHGLVRAAWSGGFLKFDPTRYGIIVPPKPDGELLFAVSEQPAFGIDADYRFRGMRSAGERVVLEATVNGVELRESPWLVQQDGLTAVARTIEVGPGEQPLDLLVLDGPGDVKFGRIGGQATGVLTSGGRRYEVALTGWNEATVITGQQSADARSRVVFRLPPRRDTKQFTLLYWSGPATDETSLAKLIAAQMKPPEGPSLAEVAAQRKPQWTESIITKGCRAPDSGPYVVDTLTLPFENPYQALFFVSGHDALPSGDLAVATVHGDVWIVSGVDADLDELTWKRFATGLFQPLGLQVVDGKIHVLGRDQITRLHDENNDGEADFYECVSNAYETSYGGHDYVACLERDAEGGFLFVHAKQGVCRIAPDGSLEIIGTGLRNPNGMGLGPGDVITAAPQEGNWTPASAIFEVRRGGHYGFGGPQVTPERPLGYVPPLCWLPRRVDNSSGGQVWVNSDRWGPFQGQLLHLSYGQCRMSLVLREVLSKAANGAVSQGGVVEFPFSFDSGVMRGRFSPHDGQLYVSGLKGWTTSAVLDGCLQRVRYTGRPVDMPAELTTHQNGIALRFTRPLDRSLAEQPGSYHLEQWNYRYAESYGSPDFRVTAPNEQGHDDVRVRSATLLDDHTVFLELPKLQPVHQMAVAYALKSKDGAPIRQTVYATIHHLLHPAIPDERLNRTAVPGQLAEDDEAALEPGLIVRYEQSGQRDARRTRMATLVAHRGEVPTPFLRIGSFTARFDGFIKVPLAGEHRFSLEGNGAARLRINGQLVLDAAGDLTIAGAKAATLSGGFNRIDIEYAAPSDGEARCRLMWESEAFAREPVPPSSLFCRSDDPELVAGEQLRRGRELFARLNCAACHEPERAAAVHRMVELNATAPNLAQRAATLEAEWLTRWLLEPRSLQNHATMPRLLKSGDEARDIAAFIQSLSTAATLGDESKASSTDADRERGMVLFEDLGCIGCHRLTPPAQEDPYDRRSLHFVATKFQPGGLEQFLKNPAQGREWSRMPDFKLEAAEIQALNVLLRGFEQADPGAQPPAASAAAGSVARGRQLFTERGCVRCHPLSMDAELLPAVPVVDIQSAQGCLAEQPHGRVGIPQFALTVAERAALLRFMEAGTGSLRHDTPAEVSQRLVASLRCSACHDRDGLISPRAGLIIEESDRGLTPEFLPGLTWTGEKLHADWTARFISGQVGERTRPWLKARMPSFGAWGTHIAAGLTDEHAVPASASHTPDPERIATGEKLIRRDGGLDCRQCHGIGAQQPQGDDKTKLAPGINFVHIRERLRPDFYSRWVLDPPRFDINTKMPKLVVDGKKTKIEAIYKGDARKQFDAIWHYIQAVDATERPVWKSPVE